MSRAARIQVHVYFVGANNNSFFLGVDGREKKRREMQENITIHYQQHQNVVQMASTKFRPHLLTGERTVTKSKMDFRRCT